MCDAHYSQTHATTHAHAHAHAHTKESNIEVSRIREYNFTRVAQAEYEYDPSAAERR